MSNLNLNTVEAKLAAAKLNGAASLGEAFNSLTAEEQQLLIDASVEAGEKQTNHTLDAAGRAVTEEIVRRALSGGEKPTEAELNAIGAAAAAKAEKKDQDEENFIRKHFSFTGKDEKVRSGWIGAGVAALTMGAEVLLNGRTSTPELIAGGLSIATSYAMGEMVDEFIENDMIRYGLTAGLAHLSTRGAMGLSNAMFNAPADVQAVPGAQPQITVVSTQAPALPVANIPAPAYPDSPVPGL